MFRPSRLFPLTTAGLLLCLFGGCIQSPYRTVYQPGRTRFVVAAAPPTETVTLPTEVTTTEAPPAPVPVPPAPSVPAIEGITPPAGDPMGAPAGQPAPELPGMMMQPAM